jgi:integrase/recombinase XerD
MFGQWCTQRDLQLFSVGRAHIELYARWLEEQGRARASTARRLSTIVSFYRYAEEEQLIAQTPAVHVRRPKLDYESGAVGLDRNEIGALLVAAGLGGTGEHALISLLASNGLRISEALGANVEDLAVERGHRALRVLRKGGKGVTIPLAPRTARAIDLAVGERVEGPIFLSVHGERLDRHAASPYGATPVPAGRVAKRIGPHSLRHAFITAALDAGVPLRDVQEAASHADPRTTMRYDRARQSLDRHAT